MSEPSRSAVIASDKCRDLLLEDAQEVLLRLRAGGCGLDGLRVMVAFALLLGDVERGGQGRVGGYWRGCAVGGGRGHVAEGCDARGPGLGNVNATVSRSFSPPSFSALLPDANVSPALPRHEHNPVRIQSRPAVARGMVCLDGMRPRARWMPARDRWSQRRSFKGESRGRGLAEME